jgi:hypothetical protein
MHVSSGALLSLLFLVTSVAPRALAQSAAASDDRRGTAGVSQRARVEVSILGGLSPADHATLLSLLESELASSGLELFAKDVAGPEPPRTTAHDAGLLMRVGLDVRSGQEWTITIIDVARNTAIRREQAGPSSDAAALEATASILGAAASALREGFELAGTMPVAPAAPTAPAAPVISPVHEEAAPAPTLVVASSLGGRVATFAREVPVQAGPAASFSLRFRNASTLRLRAAHYFADSFVSPFGSFQLDRTQLALDGGLVWTRSRVEAELSLGLATELIRRRGQKAAPGVAIGPDDDVPRVGGEILGQLRYRIFEFLAVEAGLGAAYFPKPLRFVAAVSDNRVLAEPFKLVGMGCLALELRAP